MLEVQQFLRDNNGDFNILEALYGVSANFHPTDNRVILNYCQIESSKQKTHPIVKECRGLVLDRENYEIIAKSFDRFFNLGEIEDHKNFNWNYCNCSTKEDGSLILVYMYDGKLCVNTRNSFGDGYPNGHSRTWKELVVDLLPDYFEGVLSEEMWKNHTFVFELCTPYNKVVKAYPSSLFLLGIFDTWKEYTKENVDKFALYLGLTRPKSYRIKCEDDVHQLIQKLGEENPANEGVVLDDGGMKIKVKSLLYLALHRTLNNGNVMLPKNLIPLILSGEHEEILVYFPELKPQVEKCEGWLRHWIVDTVEYYKDILSIESQKDFALRALAHGPFSSVMFRCRKSGEDIHQLFYKYKLNEKNEKVFELESLLVKLYETYLKEKENGKESCR